MGMLQKARGFDHGGPYEAPKKRGQLSGLEQVIKNSNDVQAYSPLAFLTKPISKTLLSMLGTYNPDSDRIEAGLRPGLIDDIIGMPSDIDDISGMLGHGTNLSGDTSKTAAALAEASRRRRERIMPSDGKLDSTLQGLSDVMVAVPGSTPAKMGKVARAATAVPRAIYDTVIPAMDFSTKTGKVVGTGSAALGAGLGYLSGPEDDQDHDFFADLRTKIDGPVPSEDIDALIAKAQGGDRAAYERLKVLFPQELK